MNLNLMHRLLLVAALAGWTLAVGGFLAWDLRLARQHMEELAINEARSHFKKDLAFRLWATRHGGVFVPTDKRTPPNPGLSHLPERDIKTPSGRQLTLMNPAYMLRQIMDEYSEMYGVQGKITSFQLINPINAPDPWEAEALRLFEHGEEEALEFVAKKDGSASLRLMRPMETREGCLKCHAFQGYEVGDVRGGIGVKVPMRPYLETLGATRQNRAIFFGVVWLLGMGIIVLLDVQVLRRLRAKDRYEKELEEQSRALLRANTDLTRLAEVSAHHLQEPSRRLLTFSQVLRGRFQGEQLDPEASRALDFIEQNAAYLRNLVRDMRSYLDANKPQGPSAELEIGEVLNQVRRQLAPLIKETGAEIELEPAPVVHFDRPRLRDIFSILVENSLLHIGDEAPRVVIGGERQDGVNSYWVSDNGPGIPETYRAKVFEIFQRLNHGGRGTGSGLAIVRRVVESAGGEIYLEKSEQGGLKVVFTLPDKPKKPNQPNQPNRPGQAGKRREMGS